VQLRHGSFVYLYICSYLYCSWYCFWLSIDEIKMYTMWWCRKPVRETRSLILLLLLQTLLHVVRVAIGYGLMLVVMSFNISIYIAVLLGAAIGHLSAAWTDLRLQATSLTTENRATTPSGEPQALKMTYQTCHWNCAALNGDENNTVSLTSCVTFVLVILL